MKSRTQMQKSWWMSFFLITLLAILTGGCHKHDSGSRGLGAEEVTANQAPTADFSVTVDTGDAPFDVTFDASGSSDPDGSIANYAWDFGDGSTDEGEIVTHTYTTPGTYTATLTITDDSGDSTAFEEIITVTDQDGCNDADQDGYGAFGDPSCPNGAATDCDDTNAAIHPGADDAACDGIDNDCDGSTDEDYTAIATNCGIGACAAAGTTSCVAGAVVDSCNPGTPAADDATCDGIDDDCDGQADDDYVVDASCGIGDCQVTNTPSTCINGVETACQAGTSALNDPPCNGIDDDCDGEIDEDSPLITTQSDGADINPGDGICDDGTGECTLRAAIQEANACPGADTIDLPPGTYLLTIPGTGIYGLSDDASATGDLDITDDLTITGADTASTIIDGNTLDRIFHILNNATATLDGCTIQNGVGVGGYGRGVGGGIRIMSGSTLNLKNSTVTGNTGSPDGGGIHNAGNTIISESAILNNITQWGGAGIYNNDVGMLTVINSTVDGNTSTDIGNLAARGGGILNRGTATINNTSVTYNSARSTGGVANDASINLTNTILADNSPANCGGALIVSNGYNIDSANTCGFTGVGDLVNTDPLLDVLADNGGPTLTHALDPASPAIDAGDDASCPATDQRGMSRPVDGDGDGTATCDIGAYEYEYQFTGEI